MKENREYLKVIIECLKFTVQQNIEKRCHDEQRNGLDEIRDINRSNFKHSENEVILWYHLRRKIGRYHVRASGWYGNI